MAQAPRDQNFRPTALAWNGTATSVLLADSITNRLLVKFQPDGVAISTVVPVPHDANHVPTLYAVADDGSGTLIPIASDLNGNLLVDLV